MTEPYAVYVLGVVIVGSVAVQVLRKRFDPFAPVWLFLLGYAQVYVIQAVSYREYALRVRGPELVAAADMRALWALCWFLLVYASGIWKRVSQRIVSPPSNWSVGTVGVLSPFLVMWGLFCAGLALRVEDRQMTGGESLLHNFPMVMLVAGVMLIVTGRRREWPRPGWAVAGLAVSAAYVLIWMYNGKRSHSLIGVLTTLCAWYIPRYRRPSKPVLAVAAFVGAAAVSLALGWRGNREYDRSLTGFTEYVANFDVSHILVNINLKDRNEVDPASGKPLSYETEEYGGFLLMMDTVPGKSPHDRGASYLRLVTTFIPRLVWPSKPYYGREKWVSAWVAGSEFPRDSTFTGPAISVLGAAQLNGGVAGTLILLGVLAALLRTAYEYFRLHCDIPWMQTWWALTFYNSWLMTVNDDPFVWFYYNYGFTTLIPLSALWLILKLSPGGAMLPAGRRVQAVGC